MGDEDAGPSGVLFPERSRYACGAGTLQSVLQESAEEVRSLTSALLIS